MIDFHSHIDLYPQPADVLAEASRQGCYILAVTTTPLAWDGTRSLVAPFSRVRVALGLHPELVGERHKEVDVLVNRIPEARYVGEIGLDGSRRHRASFAMQETVLSKVLAACADNGGRILSIHSRAAEDGVLDALQAHPDAGVPVLHWFSGSRRALDRAIELGCWFSAGPAMLKTKKGQTLVQAMPRERVLTETDGPFARSADQPLMPWNVTDAEARLATLWETNVVATRAQLRANLTKLTGLIPAPSDDQ